jgi:hypothetical protein
MVRQFSKTISLASLSLHCKAFPPCGSSERPGFSQNLLPNSYFNIHLKSNRFENGCSIFLWIVGTYLYCTAYKPPKKGHNLNNSFAVTTKKLRKTTIFLPEISELTLVKEIWWIFFQDNTLFLNTLRLERSRHINCPFLLHCNLRKFSSDMNILAVAIN